MKHVFPFLLLAALLTGCQSTRVASLHEHPAREDLANVLAEDEQRLWNRAREEADALDASSHVLHDSATVAYLEGVAARLVPAALAESDLVIEVRLLHSPYFNAFAYPHGAIYVHTGLLVRMENEAQLAALLSHEMAHVLERHTLRSLRDVKNRQAFLAGFQIAAMPFGIYGSLASLLGQVGVLASVRGYGRSLEAHADAVGYDLMTQAGYDPHEAVRLFALLQRDLEEQDLDEPFFFGTHPRVAERIASYEALVAQRDDTPVGWVYAERFQPIRTAYLRDVAELDVAAGRFASAYRLLHELEALYPNDADVPFLLGRAYEQDPEIEDGAAQAEVAYRRTLDLDADHADALRALGLLHYQAARCDEAAPLLERHLALAPDAPDRGYLEHYLTTCHAAE